MHLFDAALRALLAANLGRHVPYDHVSDGVPGRVPSPAPFGLEAPSGRPLRQAAVAVVVTDSDVERHGVDSSFRDPGRLAAIPGAEGLTLTGRLDGVAGGPAVLLTRRAAKLRAHGGQWALPGGRVDPGEDPLDAALRELHEELGLHLGRDALLGRLDDYPTRSGYVIRPFVFWGGADPELVPDPSEVESVHRVALRELVRADSPRFVSIPESERPVIQLPIGGDLIHAPTAAVLYQFRLVAVEGVSAPVHHYEQPTFAWR